MAAVDGAGAAGEPPVVLVLDDEPDVLHLLRIVLERRGFRVLATADGREALRLLREETVRVALVDLLMPGMSGRQFLAEVGRLEARRRPVVLVVSALRAESADRELGGAGDYALVAKPFDMAEIQERVVAASAAWEAARGPRGQAGPVGEGPAC